MSNFEYSDPPIDNPLPDIYLYGENVPNEVVLYMKLAAASLNTQDQPPTFSVIEKPRQGYGAKGALLMSSKTHILLRGAWVSEADPEAELERLADMVDVMMYDMADVDEKAAVHYVTGK